LKEGLRDERKAQKVVTLQISLFEKHGHLNLLHPNAFWCILLRKDENIQNMAVELHFQHI